MSFSSVFPTAGFLSKTQISFHFAEPKNATPQKPKSMEDCQCYNSDYIVLWCLAVIIMPAMALSAIWHSSGRDFFEFCNRSLTIYIEEYIQKFSPENMPLKKGWFLDRYIVRKSIKGHSNFFEFLSVLLLRIGFVGFSVEGRKRANANNCHRLLLIYPLFQSHQTFSQRTHLPLLLHHGIVIPPFLTWHWHLVVAWYLLHQLPFDSQVVRSKIFPGRVMAVQLHRPF